MILDNKLAMVTTVPLDLGNPGERTTAVSGTNTVAPHGPGRQVRLSITGITAGTVNITTADTAVAGSALITAACPAGETTEVRLPSNCKRYITATFADGSIDVILDCAQTNV